MMNPATWATVHASLRTVVAAGLQEGCRRNPRDWWRGVQNVRQSVAWHAQSFKTQPQHGIRDIAEAVCHLQQQSGRFGVVRRVI